MRLHVHHIICYHRRRRFLWRFLRTTSSTHPGSAVLKQCFSPTTHSGQLPCRCIDPGLSAGYSRHCSHIENDDMNGFMKHGERLSTPLRDQHSRRKPCHRPPTAKSEQFKLAPDRHLTPRKDRRSYKRSPSSLKKLRCWILHATLSIMHNRRLVR